MRLHWLQHVPYEGLGHLKSWATARGATLTCTRMFAGDPLPPVSAFDLLVILGGPMSVNEEATLPWLAAEKSFIRDVLAADKAVFGICLGAQLITSALGAPVGPSPEREVGWWPVTRVAPAAGDVRPRFAFPAEITCLQWHGESFALPPGAIHLAQSPGCPHQALQLGRRVVGVQFHPEATPAWLDEVLSRSPGALLPGRYITSETDLLRDPDGRCRQPNLLAENILDYLTAGADEADI